MPLVHNPANTSYEQLHTIPVFHVQEDEFKLKKLQRCAIQLVLEMDSLAYEKNTEDCGLIHLEHED